jgi:hypothetical protein
MVYQKEGDAAAHTSGVSEKNTSRPRIIRLPPKRRRMCPTAMEATTPGNRCAVEPAKYVLEIVCHENTWLKVIADDARATEHQFETW